MVITIPLTPGLKLHSAFNEIRRANRKGLSDGDFLQIADQAFNIKSSFLPPVDLLTVLPVYFAHSRLLPQSSRAYMRIFQARGLLPSVKANSAERQEAVTAFDAGDFGRLEQLAISVGYTADQTTASQCATFVRTRETPAVKLYVAGGLYENKPLLIRGSWDNSLTGQIEVDIHRHKMELGVLESALTWPFRNPFLKPHYDRDAASFLADEAATLRALR